MTTVPELLARWEARLASMPDYFDFQRRDRQLVAEFIASLKEAA